MRGLDVTFNAPKSVSLLRGVAGDDVRGAIEAGHDAAVEAVLGFLQRHAHARVSVDGQVLVLDADGLIVGTFRQHTSRALDPHLHTHAVVITKVQVPGRGWYALDALMAIGDQRTLSALYHAGLRAELTRRLGVAWQVPDNGIAELADVPPELCQMFSQRSAQVQERIETKLSRFQRSRGREPTVAERYRLQREAVADSRPAKRSTRHIDLLGDWREELSAAGTDPDDLVHEVTHALTTTRQLRPEDGEAMSKRCLTALADDRSSWRRGDVVREMARATPTTLGVPAPRVISAVEMLAEDAIVESMFELHSTAEHGERRRDGRSVTEGYRDRRLSLPAILAEEGWLLGWAEQRWANPGRPIAVTGEGLDRAQRAVAAAVAGTAELVVVVGPAGAGKTTALAPAHYTLARSGRPVFGLAPSASAAGILRAETAMAADTIDKLLHEHSQADRPPRPGFDLPAGTTVVMDEAGMVSTPKLARLARLADQRRWRMVLIGDPHQLAAVGRGGMFSLLVSTGPTVELETVHRFRNAWERQASLALRRGDPGVLAVYDAHKRLHSGCRADMEDRALDAWRRARTLSRSALLLSTTNEGAERLSVLAQQDRLRRCEIDDESRLDWPDGRRVCLGDEVVTRHNERTLCTDRGVMVKNRAAWTVTAIHPDASLSVRGVDGAVQLPARYVNAYVELGYAQTTHAAQGRTVDEAILVADGYLDSRGLYVGLTRGRHANSCNVITPGDGRSGYDVLEGAIRRDWADEPATLSLDDLDRRAVRAELEPFPLLGRGVEEASVWSGDRSRGGPEDRTGPRDRVLGGSPAGTGILTVVNIDDARTAWTDDAEVLGRIGCALFSQPTRVTVRLPRALAARALAAWDRADDYEAELPPETAEQRATRHRAGTLGLIGLSLQDRGADDGDEVVVELDAWYIGSALETADELGLLAGLPVRTPTE